MPEVTVTEKKKKGRKKIEGETKEQTLVRLASRRTQRILGAVSSLGKLGRLKPSDSQRNRVFNAIKESVESAHASWQGGQQAQTDFHL